MKKLALLTALLLSLVAASAVPALARVDQAAQDAASEAQSNEQNLVQTARQAVEEAQRGQTANQPVAQTKAPEQDEPEGQANTEQAMPETGGLITGTQVALLLGGGVGALITGGFVLRRVSN